jgi:proline iminopeptidase
MKKLALVLPLLAACATPPIPDLPPTPKPPAASNGPTATPVVPAGLHIAAKTDLFTKTLGDPKNPAIVYVHGGPGGNGTMFEDTIAQTLVDKGFYAVSYDQRGSGRSPKGEAKDFTVAKFVDDLDDVIFTLGLEKPVLIGHSWGGTVSMRYQDAHPDKIAGTVLVDHPIDFPDSLMNIQDRCIAWYGERFFVQTELDAVNALKARMFPHGLQAPYTFDSADIGATMQAAAACKLYWPDVSNLVGNSAETWGKLLVSSPDKDLLMSTVPEVGANLEANEHLFEGAEWDLLAKLKDRVFAIYGSEDGLFSESQVARIQSTVSRDHFTLIDGASHVVFVDAPDDFVAAFTKYDQALR